MQSSQFINGYLNCYEFEIYHFHFKAGILVKLKWIPGLHILNNSIQTQPNSLEQQNPLRLHGYGILCLTKLF